ncbi:MAG: hypothetical protein L0H81_00185, partial [Actinomyces sp.]|nr:hypothetical protein [Actinomyces sp.]MDN6428296.1 hypothetical protein [Propionibacterium sp.]MDN6565496.1 hypothetical protein [Actinomyces sp.]MDN6795640.1 hypothetical protein [Propionibacterium sp.]
MIKGVPAPSKEVISLVFKRILPILFLAYVMNFLDRSNISMVKSELATDLGIDALAYGMGSGLFFGSCGPTLVFRTPDVAGPGGPG